MASSVGMFCVHFKFSGEIKNMRRNEEMRGKNLDVYWSWLNQVKMLIAIVFKDPEKRNKMVHLACHPD